MDRCMVLNCISYMNFLQYTVYQSFVAMMTSSNGNIFRVTSPLCGGIHRSSVNSPLKGQRAGALMNSLICAWASGWVNKWNAGDLRHNRTHYGVIVMALSSCCLAVDMLPLASEITQHYLCDKPLPESMGINYDNTHSIKWYWHARYEMIITFANRFLFKL